jgi:hypothetical protein
MQAESRKRDALIQDLYAQVRSPQRGRDVDVAEETAQLLADAKREIEGLREETSALRRSQQEILQSPRAGGKWAEFLETPISVSQRRSRRESHRQSRYLPPQNPWLCFVG